MKTVIKDLLAEYDMSDSAFAKDLREALAEQPAPMFQPNRVISYAAAMKLRELGYEWMNDEWKHLDELAGQPVPVPWSQALEAVWAEDDDPIGEAQDKLIAEQAAQAQPAPAAPVQQHSTCNNTLLAQGKAYPRTCRQCGLGPCAEIAHAHNSKENT